MVLPKIAVAQLGARRHYQQPVLLHQLGCLEALYTDFYAGDSWPARLLHHPQIEMHLPGSIKRVADRYDPALKDAKVVYFPSLAYQYAKTLKQLKGKSPSATFAATGKAFCHRIIQHGLGNADTIYGFNSASLELFQYAKQQGLRCILDQTLAERFYYYQLMQAEECRWPSWSISPFILTDADRELAEREQQEQDLADHIICGSDFVKLSLIARGLSPEKITVVSLGRIKELELTEAGTSVSEDSQFPWSKRSEGLHILFAGSVGLRKGIPYMLEALRQLKGKIPFACKVAGSIELQPDVLTQYSDVCEFLGRIPRSEMATLYGWADVFVLPSLCEGSAMVTYEALQYGLPIIVTQNTGSIIRDGIDGWIVPVQDADAITKSVIDLFEKGHNPNFTEKLLIYYKQSYNYGVGKFKDAVLSNSPNI